MKKRQLIYLALAIVIALIIYAIERPEEPRIGASSSESLLTNFDSADVMRMEVEQLLDASEITRDGDVWAVADKLTPPKRELLAKEGVTEPDQARRRADAGRVANALGTFTTLERGVLVSENPDKRSLYQVDASGLRVKLFGVNDKPIIDLVIGKNGPDFGSAYIRKSDENSVYLVRRPLAGIFSPRADDWREKKLWSTDPNEISDIEVSSPAGSWHAAREGGDQWKLVSPEERSIDTEKMRAIMGKLANPSAVGFADLADEKNAGFDSPYAVMTISLGKDKKVTFTIGKALSPTQKDKKPDRYYAKIEGNDERYLISKETVYSIPLEAPK